jgi:hypothetical protein
LRALAVRAALSASARLPARALAKLVDMAFLMRKKNSDDSLTNYWSRWDDIFMWSMLLAGMFFVIAGLVLPFVEERVGAPRATGLFSWFSAIAHLRYAVWLKAVIFVSVGCGAIRAFFSIRRKHKSYLKELKP